MYYQHPLELKRGLALNFEIYGTYDWNFNWFVHAQKIIVVLYGVACLNQVLRLIHTTTEHSVKRLFSFQILPGWTDRIDLMRLPQNILLSIWASNSSAWAGPVTSDTVNAEAVYDWVEMWTYNP